MKKNEQQIVVDKKTYVLFIALVVFALFIGFGVGYVSDTSLPCPGGDGQECSVVISPTVDEECFFRYRYDRLDGIDEKRALAKQFCESHKYAFAYAECVVDNQTHEDLGATEGIHNCHDYSDNRIARLVCRDTVKEAWEHHPYYDEFTFGGCV